MYIYVYISEHHLIDINIEHSLGKFPQEVLHCVCVTWSCNEMLTDK